jgi:hypothetical protein
VRLAKVSASPCEVTRFDGDVARLSEAPYLVKFQMKGESHWSQRSKTVHLTPGDFVIASMAEPYSLQLFEDFEMPVLALTSRTMHTLTRDPDQFLGVRMAVEEADCGVLSSFVSQVVARISRLQEPWIAVEMLVTREPSGGGDRSFGKAEAISLKEAVDLFTVNSARHRHLEGMVGAIATGMLADLIVLDRDPFDTPVHRLHEVRVMTTIINGEVVFQR